MENVVSSWAYVGDCRSCVWTARAHLKRVVKTPMTSFCNVLPCQVCVEHFPWGHVGSLTDFTSACPAEFWCWSPEDDKSGRREWATLPAGGTELLSLLTNISYSRCHSKIISDVSISWTYCKNSSLSPVLLSALCSTDGESRSEGWGRGGAPQAAALHSEHGSPWRHWTVRS